MSSIITTGFLQYHYYVKILSITDKSVTPLQAEQIYKNNNYYNNRNLHTKINIADCN